MSINFLNKLFLSRSLKHQNFSVLKTDMHSHILPGIDDGAPDLETSINLIKELKKLGYKKLIATPHIMSDIHPNTPEIIKEKLEIVKNEVRNQEIDIEIEAAAEYLLDENFETILDNKNWLLFGDKYILVELSFIAPPRNLESYIFRLRTHGLTPVLAHPERYLYFVEEYYRYGRLKEMGCKFQINLLSLTGYYGREVKSNALKLLRKNWVEFLGSDCHSMKHVEYLTQGFRKNAYEKVFSNFKFNNSKLNFDA